MLETKLSGFSPQYPSILQRGVRSPSLQHQLVVNQRRLSVNDPPTLRVPTLGVEPTRARFRVVRIEAYRARRPRLRHLNRLVQQATPDALALQLGTHRHALEVQRLGDTGEVRHVDCPRLARAQLERP